ncbi:DUF7545 family protein [Natronobacterium gregoryi]|uniref:Uncharacterized protein n=2 Tax=Natronobacterium gregoryi TaxID=44930 RepID=L0AKD5_NATGS|nr:hypothetical protein [Natronobacterium gregoryi]AFZ73919.1 hypothetical protein Natgr_2774 [Natronobacterium gregoryi SP2]ELY71559.1 hypothetical protein C490_04892 [Natronobacterium gregoryi SP2]PLK19062.1 hypothetical protein CYV19_16880 [Natronobacterium gregoryi SP2]SFJ63194.1 hypothetical protein SAMN05443661_14915 [Natronobacterium gregoryi]
MSDVETVTVSIDADDSTDEVTLPAGLMDLVAEGDQTAAETVGDVTLLSFASRAHHVVHHGDGADEDLEAQEERIMELFEERFGVTFGEATGHQH